ncbi:hypothetical protein LCGC14_2636610 [marine sediment metagenome]|uniref:Uncharacterized protein n=1 Tax=marine sediment metagenome TaxID=412755 RepID=A0A0F8ZYZ7_9ZZZZ
MSEWQAIETSIDELKQASLRLKKGQIWSAYKLIRKVRSRLYLVERDCAYTSPQASLHWGRGFRVSGGKVVVVRL